ncbi:hypothetical protein CC78DRAFT_55054 [Lojkania enalia]|uniref:Uncharacterized protein n=1 Tax=Lojkania enalia TaxID=147567 RepID=A0A9P4K027_9PLEO|nr:hypothetical protein CC78DRAFT_55054 [Didymosphaeria enalia]
MLDGVMFAWFDAELFNVISHRRTDNIRSLPGLSLRRRENSLFNDLIKIIPLSVHIIGSKSRMYSDLLLVIFMTPAVESGTMNTSPFGNIKAFRCCLIALRVLKFGANIVSTGGGCSVVDFLVMWQHWALGDRIMSKLTVSTTNRGAHQTLNQPFVNAHGEEPPTGIVALNDPVAYHHDLFQFRQESVENTHFGVETTELL